MPRKQGLKDRIHEVRDRYSSAGMLTQLALTVVGVLLVAAGLVMIVLPGPAFIVIPIGLALLSVRFTWASRLIDFAIDEGAQVGEAAKNLSRKKWLLLSAAVLCLLIAIGAFLWLR